MGEVSRCVSWSLCELVAVGGVSRYWLVAVGLLFGIYDFKKKHLRKFCFSLLPTCYPRVCGWRRIVRVQRGEGSVR